MSTFKKIKDGVFEKTDTTKKVIILNEEDLKSTKEFLEGEIDKLQSKLASVNGNLKGIKNAKK